MTERCRKELVNYFLASPTHLEQLVYIAQEICAYSGNMEWINAFDYDDYLYICIEGGQSDVKNFIELSVESGITDGMIRFDCYGRMECADIEVLMQDVKSNIVEVMDYMDEYIDDYGNVKHIYICDHRDTIDNIIRNNSLIMEDKDD